jgi:hypothetical protein
MSEGIQEEPFSEWKKGSFVMRCDGVLTRFILIGEMRHPETRYLSGQLRSL